LSEDKKTHVLPWYIVVLLSVVTVVALVMTWYSMMDLGVSYLSLPVWLAVGVSLTFDGGAVFLSWMSVQYAKTTDSGFWTELAAFGFIGTGVYIVVQHAVLAGYPEAGIIMFAAAPVIVGIMLKVTLNYYSRQARKQAGRVTEKLPSVGWLTWLRYMPQTWRLMSVAMQGRLINAADKLDIGSDTHDIFKTRVLAAQTVVRTTPDTISDMSETSKELSGQPDKPALTSSDNLSLPVWLPHEPTMSFGTLVRTCLDNGMTDLESVYRLSLTLKGQDVNKASLSRTLAREKTKRA
jgi:hypothetical protein